METRNVKVGVVGYGYWGPKLVRNFAEIPEANLRWVVDLDGTRLSRVRAQYPGVETTGDMGQVLRSNVEALVVATPIRTHYRVAKAALEAGKHVLVEKPLTACSAEAEELVDIAERRGLVLMAGHTFVYNAAVRTLRQIVASGEIGQVYYADSARLNLGLFRTDINVLWDLAPHDLSILRYVLQKEPLAVSARGSANVTRNVHDVAYVEVRFPDGVIAHLHLSWLDPCKVRRVTVVGSKKMVVYDDVSDTEKIRIYDKGVERSYETDRFNEFPLTYRYGSQTIPYIPVREPLRVQCEHFLHAIRSGTRPDTDGRDALRVVRILEQADRSLQNGGARESLHLQDDEIAGRDVAQPPAEPPGERSEAAWRRRATWGGAFSAEGETQHVHAN